MLKKISYIQSFLVALIPLFILLIILINVDLNKILEVPNIIQVALFYGLFVYSLETFFLRKTTEDNLLYNQCPCLVPRIRHMSDGNYQIKIKNIGKGVAIDVSLVILIDSKNYYNNLYQNVKFLPVEDEKSIQFSNQIINKGDNLKNFNNTFLYEKKKEFKIKITCKDASNNQMSHFEYEFKFKENEWEIYTIKIGKN